MCSGWPRGGIPPSWSAATRSGAGMENAVPCCADTRSGEKARKSYLTARNPFAHLERAAPCDRLPLRARPIAFLLLLLLLVWGWVNRQAGGHCLKPAVFTPVTNDGLRRAHGPLVQAANQRSTRARSFRRACVGRGKTAASELRRIAIQNVVGPDPVAAVSRPPLVLPRAPNQFRRTTPGRARARSTADGGAQSMGSPHRLATPTTIGGCATVQSDRVRPDAHCREHLVLAGRRGPAQHETGCVPARGCRGAEQQS